MCKKLQDIKNLRTVQPRCCATCTYRYDDKGVPSCKRSMDWIDLLVGDETDIYMQVCDGYKRPNFNSHNNK